MEYVTRINLNTDCGDNRPSLIDYCLHGEDKCVALGWSCTYEYKKVFDFDSYAAFYYASKEYIKSSNEKSRVNPALNLFWYVKPNDLFWTRDLQGYYWICRAKDVAKPKLIKDLDIGAIVPVEAYKVGLEVPGEIKASFNRANGGIVQKIYEKVIINFSKYTYNCLCGEEYYKDIDKTEGSIVSNLPDFELEELVISYIQLKEDYYLLSNSIAKKSTTILIEGEFISRNLNNPCKAVVQVKGEKKEIDTSMYNSYLNDGYEVYLYSGKGILGSTEGFHIISKNELVHFYEQYKRILPDSITKWENLFN